jgi:hypothetical protein
MHVSTANARLSDVTPLEEYATICRAYFAQRPRADTIVGCELVGVEIAIDCIAVLPDSRGE